MKSGVDAGRCFLISPTEISAPDCPSKVVTVVDIQQNSRVIQNTSGMDVHDHILVAARSPTQRTLCRGCKDPAGLSLAVTVSGLKGYRREDRKRFGSGGLEPRDVGFVRTLS